MAEPESPGQPVFQAGSVTVVVTAVVGAIASFFGWSVEQAAAVVTAVNAILVFALWGGPWSVHLPWRTVWDSVVPIPKVDPDYGHEEPQGEPPDVA